jgi:hypothetical protein
MFTCPKENENTQKIAVANKKNFIKLEYFEL